MNKFNPTHFGAIGGLRDGSTMTRWGGQSSPASRCPCSLAAGLSTVRVVALLAFSLTACSTTPKVNTQAKTGADFTRYHTFALMPLPTTGPASDPGLMLRVAEPARKAAVEALTAKGLTEAEPAIADIAVNLRGQFLPKVEVTNYGYAAGPVGLRRGGYAGVGYYQGQQVSNYEERTLTIEVFDNHTKELTWVGWSKHDATTEVDIERLKAAISRILSEFPAGTTTSTH